MSARTSRIRPRPPDQEHQAGSWDTITAALEAAVGPGKATGEWTRYCCPAHEGDGRGHHPSLGIKYSVREQRTVVRCFAGCDNTDVLASVHLEVRDMFDRPRARGIGRARAPRTSARPRGRAENALAAMGLPQRPHKPDLGAQLSGWRHVDTYAYLDADGAVLGEVLRREATFEGGRGKSFSQRAWDPQLGDWRDSGFAKVPYQLPEVLAAIEAGQAIYLVEGEKDAESGRRAGLITTTNAGGALGWTDEHSQYLRGAKLLVIVVDRDAAGFRRADRIRTSAEGLVERVRVVCAATGKDLTNHLDAGHEIADMIPVPHLDPYTPIPAAAVDSNSGGITVPEHQLVPQLRDHAPDQTPDIDHMGAHWSRFMQMLLAKMLEAARKAADARRIAQETVRAQAEQQQREAAAALAAERKTVEARLIALRKSGWNNATRGQITAAVRDAAEWAPDSVVANEVMGELVNHVHTRWGLRVDAETGEVRADVPVELVQALAAAETERAGAARLGTASARMAQLVATAEGLDESARQTLFASVQAWREQPTAAQLAELDAALKAAKVDEQVRIRVRFVAGYLGPDATLPVAQLGVVAPVAPTAELRKMATPLVDPGEEVKHRVDTLLLDYQARLRHGRDTEGVQHRLGDAVALMTEEDREIARKRGSAIRANPGGEFAPLWPDHVDREALAESVRMYAVLEQQADYAAAAAGDLDAAAAVGLRREAAKCRQGIDNALTRGKGLHDLERDQVRAVLADVEAGVTVVPELLFASDRFAASVDAVRADALAESTTQIHRRQLDQILAVGSVPAAARYQAADEVTWVFTAQTQLAAGHISLADYEQRGLDARLGAALTRAGVPEPIRNTVRHHLDQAAGECAISGKQAVRVATRWAERSEHIAEQRATAPGYGSPEHRAEQARDLDGAGLAPDEVAQRMAAEAGHAAPASEATRPSPGQARTRTTAQGSGVRRTHHRGKGKGQGLGR